MSEQQSEPVPPTMEYIDAGPAGGAVVPQVIDPLPRRRRSWVPIVVGLVTFVVVLVGAVLVLADWAERNLEMRALVTNVETSEAAMADVQEAIRDMAVHFDPNTPLTEEEQAAVDAELKRIASQGADGVGRAGGLVAAVPVLPWHADILAAQQAYLAHNQAWQDYLTAAAADPTEFAKPQDAVNETFAAAERPMRTAVPPLALFELKRRIDVIYAPPPEQSDGPTQQA